MTAMTAITATTSAAQDGMSEDFRRGIVEEEANRNPVAAIQNYQAAIARFDEARQTAATALFRMAECYRKPGDTNGYLSCARRPRRPATKSRTRHVRLTGKPWSLK